MIGSRSRRPARRSPVAAKRRPFDLDKDTVVRLRPHFENSPLPLRLEPAIANIDLLAWTAHHKAEIEELLWQHSALLFRGFGVESIDAFEAFVHITSNGKPLSYRDRTTPRKTKGDRIYTSTIHPADQRINLHNEGTYWERWALKLYFCCIVPARTGGQTPIADVRNVYRRIDREIREAFETRQMMLVRNYNDGFGLPWQEVYQTQSKDEVETYCRDNRIEFEWKEDDRLRTQQIRPAVHRHPKCGAPVWFNHVAFFHYTTLEAELRDALLSEFGLDHLPFNTYYGDGAPIEPAVVEHIRQAYAAEEVRFDWQAGDVLLLDNMSVAHAREPYTGDRQVLTAMTEGYAGDRQRESALRWPNGGSGEVS